MAEGRWQRKQRSSAICHLPSVSRLFACRLPPGPITPYRRFTTGGLEIPFSTAHAASCVRDVNPSFPSALAT